MSDFELVLYTAVVMTLLFAGILVFCFNRFSLPVRKYDGYLDIMMEDAKQINQLDIRTEPKDLKNQKRLVLKIRQIPPKPQVEQVADIT